jgi:co-chaperonin GroES (HSP10)
MKTNANYAELLGAKVAPPERPAAYTPGWRAAKGPAEGNTSGFSATGHRVLLLGPQAEEVTASGLILSRKTVDENKATAVLARVVEIGPDAWSDKSTDFAQVGDVVLIGQYVGKFHKSELDGLEYRFVSDLDIISRVNWPKELTGL